MIEDEEEKNIETVAKFENEVGTIEVWRREGEDDIAVNIHFGDRGFSILFDGDEFLKYCSLFSKAEKKILKAMNSFGGTQDEV